MAREYKTPNFNLLAFGFSPGLLPGIDIPTLVDARCQLYVHSRADIDVTPGRDEFWVPPVYIRFPRIYAQIARGWIIKIDERFEMYFKVRWAQLTHMGFPNEYLTTQCEQCTVDGTAPLPIVP